MIAPKFIPKKYRSTISERENIENEMVEIQQQDKIRAVERKQETRQIVIEEIRKEDQQKLLKDMGDHSDEEMPDDRDNDANEEEEIEKWKIRELNRIKRNRDKEEKEKEEKKLIEKRRNMTDREILHENARLGLHKKKVESKMKYLQKYYHAGAFYHDDSFEKRKIKTKNFSGPTGEDKDLEKSELPRILQVKRYGIAGRTKYTHLVDQDSSNLIGDTNPWKEAAPAVSHTKRKRYN